MLIDVFAAIFYVSVKPKTPDQIIHPIEAAQHRAFTAPGRSDKSRDGVLLDRNPGITNRFEGAVIKLFDIAIDNYFVFIFRIRRSVVWMLDIYIILVCY